MYGLLLNFDKIEAQKKGVHYWKMGYDDFNIHNFFRNVSPFYFSVRTALTNLTKQTYQKDFLKPNN